MTGRPLRFLGLIVMGWSGVRVAILWPSVDSVPALIRAIAPPVAAATAFYAEAPVTRPVVAHAPTAATPTKIVPIASAIPTPATTSPPTPAARPAEPDLPRSLRLPSLSPTSKPGRWSASLWAIGRTGLAETRPGNQLGGSQAGIRLRYTFDRTHRLAASARFATALDGGAREAAFGLDWQPTAAPVHLLVEQRVALNGGRGGPAALVVAGLDPHPLPLGLTAEAYAQAGAVVRGRLDGFADGAVRVTRPVTTAGGLRLDLGIGGWAGAQRGAARVDIGPTASLGVPMHGRVIRLTLDWRQRIAGDARPGSGPALTLGTDL
ncbi:hypothetical protein Q5H91_15375 [Sphingomonas sp. KR1UV-12]|uniref:Secreted protein n=1 Tax=Sphingomonas aurea TaxID=3063994 RepID=A0ABT9ENR8_9SPHN|nr:hypothetical protein [Sphingomonas sp. KR1UV-12]MDP1028604.1 hypothetical protein [Sphingomonas sp. KR1UV-12]